LALGLLVAVALLPAFGIVMANDRPTVVSNWLTTIPFTRGKPALHSSIYE
jgi:hypothetical protein